MLSPVYTIGYQERSIEQFVALLKRHQIAVLVDVRSRPTSSFEPDFSLKPLQSYLETRGIQYVYLGKMLGGFPEDPDAYTNGKTDYAKLRQKPYYHEGIEQLLELWEQGRRLALMCFEIRPQECHRALLVGETLNEQGIEVVHIDETGGLKAHQVVIEEARQARAAKQ